MVAFESPREYLIREGIKRLKSGKHIDVAALALDLGIIRSYSPDESRKLEIEIMLRSDLDERSRVVESYKIEDYRSHSPDWRPAI